MEFSDPPMSKRGVRSERWINIVKELKANPNMWAIVGTFSPGVATQIRRGEFPAFVEGCTIDPKVYMDMNWEITTRKVSEGRSNNLWIRWIGES